MTAQDWVYFFLAVSALSLIVAFFFTRQVGLDQGTDMHNIASGITEGAVAFLKSSYKLATVLLGLLLPTFAYAQPEHAGGGEANLVLPDLSTVHFFGMTGHALLMIGLLFCVGGLLFGLAIYVQLKNAPVHRSMLEISELIYETCKTYLITQGKFIMLLWVFIAVIISMYFGWLAPVPGKSIAVTSDSPPGRFVGIHRDGAAAGAQRGRLTGPRIPGNAAAPEIAIAKCDAVPLLLQHRGLAMRAEFAGRATA